MNKKNSEVKGLGLGYLVKVSAVSLCSMVMLIAGVMNLSVGIIIIHALISMVFLCCSFYAEGYDGEYEEVTKNSHKFLMAGFVFAVLLALLMLFDSFIITALAAGVCFCFRYHLSLLLWEKHAREELTDTFNKQYMDGEYHFYVILIVICLGMGGFRALSNYVNSPEYQQEVVEEKAKNTITFVVDSVMQEVHGKDTWYFIISEDKCIFYAPAYCSEELKLTKKGDTVSCLVDENGRMRDFDNLRYEIVGNKIIEK